MIQTPCESDMCHHVIFPFSRISLFAFAYVFTLYCEVCT